MTVRACITGTGVVTPAGVGRAEFFARLVEGGAPDLVAPRVAAGVPVPALAHVTAPRLDAEQLIEARALRKVSDHTRLLTVAAALCLEDAGLRDADAEATGVCIGTSFGSSDYHLECHEAMRRRGVPGASALLFSQSVFNAAPGHIGQVFGCMGTNSALVGGEAVGLEAIVRSATRLRAGADHVLLAGGGEQYTDRVHASLFASGLVGDRVGGVPGPFTEGAALVALEPVAGVRARGATPMAEVLGGATARGVAPSATLERAARLACERSATDPADVDLLIFCPPAGPDGRDHFALAACIGARYVAMPTLALGEGFSFTSALAACIGALALAEGVVPPTSVRDGIPAGLDADRAPDVATPARLERVLILASTTRATATALLLGRSESDGA